MQDKYLRFRTFFFSFHGRGGFGRGQGRAGENGTVTGKACPKGLYGIFCQVVLKYYHVLNALDLYCGLFSCRFYCRSMILTLSKTFMYLVATSEDENITNHGIHRYLGFIIGQCW